MHTDRGCHYRWPGWKSSRGEHGLTAPMSRKGKGADNAAMEGFFGGERVLPRQGWSGSGRRVRAARPLDEVVPLRLGGREGGAVVTGYHRRRGGRGSGWQCSRSENVRTPHGPKTSENSPTAPGGEAGCRAADPGSRQNSTYLPPHTGPSSPIIRNSSSMDSTRPCSAHVVSTLSVNPVLTARK